MNAAILRRSISFALAAVVCGFALFLSLTAPANAQSGNSSSTTVVAAGSDATPTAPLNDGFHW